MAKDVVGTQLAAGIERKNLARLHKIFIAALPADAFVGTVVLHAARFLEVHQVDDDLARANLPGQYSAIDAPRSDHNDLRLCQGGLKIGAEQGANVGNHFVDVLAVRPDQVAERETLSSQIFRAPPHWMVRRNGRCLSIVFPNPMP